MAYSYGTVSLDSSRVNHSMCALLGGYRKRYFPSTFLPSVFFYLFTRVADPSHFGKIRIHRSQHGLIDPDPDEVPSPIITDFQAHNPKYVFFLLLFEVTLFIIPKI